MFFTRTQNACAKSQTFQTREREQSSGAVPSSIEDVEEEVMNTVGMVFIFDSSLFYGRVHTESHTG